MAAPDSAGKCVLIVEDNVLNMKLFSAMVAAQGYGVLQASDGTRGLDMAHREDPDLIIMDVKMPGISGLEATRILKDDPDTRDIPIIVTSGYGMHGDDAEVRASGCDGFIAKPIGVREFLELIELVMRHSGHQPRLVRRLIEESTEAA
jgi:two-component system cell cycle response regulator DivK